MILKFRVWDKQQRRYLATVDGSWFEVFPTRDESLQVERSGKRGFINLGFAVQRDDLYSVEQFTGVKDKNGKEIYLNDMVRVNDEEFLIAYKGAQFICYHLKKSYYSEHGLDTVWFGGGEPMVTGAFLEHLHKELTQLVIDKLTYESL